jgi:hypothetical protein
MPNLFHKIGDAAAIVSARIRQAFRVLTGRYPLPTLDQEANMAIIDDVMANLAKVKGYVATLESKLADADMTPQLTAINAELTAMLPPPEPTPDPVTAEAPTATPAAPTIDPATGDVVTG